MLLDVEKEIAMNRTNDGAGDPWAAYG